MDFELIKTSVKGDSLREEEWEEELEGCGCELECSAETRCSCLMDGQDNYTTEGRLIPSSRPLLECHDNCGCCLLETCRNRIVQNGVVKKLKVFETKEKGYGVKCDETIEENEFVCEYAGEVIDEDEVNRRAQLFANETHNYVFTLKEHTLEGVRKTFIDPRFKGNVGRWLNHSCEPNCRIVVCRVGRMVPKVSFFANRRILPGEELCYCYGEPGKAEINPKRCHCRAENCRKFLPMTMGPTE